MSARRAKRPTDAEFSKMVVEELNALNQRKKERNCIHLSRNYLNNLTLIHSDRYGNYSSCILEDTSDQSWIIGYAKRNPKDRKNDKIAAQVIAAKIWERLISKNSQ